MNGVVESNEVQRGRRKEPLSIEPRMLSIEQAAKYIGLSKRTLYNRTAPKSKNPFPIRPKRTLGKPLFDKVELDKWLDTLDAVSSGESESE